MLVNLEVADGYRDAIRTTPSDAAVSAHSLWAAGTDWAEHREGAFPKDGQQSLVKLFGLYDYRTDQSQDMLLNIAYRVDNGLQSVIASCDDEPGSGPLGITSLDQLSRYSAVGLGGGNYSGGLYEKLKTGALMLRDLW